MKFLGWQLSPSDDSRQNDLERESVHYIIESLYVHRDNCELEVSGGHSYVMLLVICNVYTFVCRCAEQRQRTRVEPN